jgi:hypothetical protein
MHAPFDAAPWMGADLEEGDAVSALTLWCDGCGFRHYGRLGGIAELSEAVARHYRDHLGCGLRTGGPPGQA